jgi:hypothetical protein
MVPTMRGEFFHGIDLRAGAETFSETSAAVGVMAIELILKN